MRPKAFSAVGSDDKREDCSEMDRIDGFTEARSAPRLRGARSENVVPSLSPTPPLDATRELSGKGDHASELSVGGDRARCGREGGDAGSGANIESLCGF